MPSLRTALAARAARAALAALVLHAPAAAAQSPSLDSLRAGTRVRVSTAELPRATGTMLAYRGGSLLLRRDRSRDSVWLAVPDLQALDVSVARRRPVVRRTLTGLVVGALIGAGIGTVGGDQQTGDGPLTRENKMAIGAIVIGGAGTIVGFLTGIAKTDVWRAVPLPPRPS
jgi:hypothetical protein